MFRHRQEDNVLTNEKEEIQTDCDAYDSTDELFGKEALLERRICNVFRRLKKVVGNSLH